LFWSLTENVSGYLSLLVPAIFVSGTLALEAIQPAFNPISQTVSMLVWYPHGWVQTALFSLLGATLFMLAWKLRRTGMPGKKVKTGYATLLLSGLGFVAISIFPSGIPGQPHTLVHTIHTWAAVILTIVGPFSSLLLAPVFKTGKKYNPAYILCLVLGFNGLVLNIAGLAIIIYGFPWIGAVERVIMLNGLVWAQLLAWQLYKSMHVKNALVVKAWYPPVYNAFETRLALAVARVRELDARRKAR
jgi:hypothetical protein